MKYPQIEEKNIDDITLLEPEMTYNYSDYLKWTFKERVELIKGKVFEMSPAPRTYHQEISINLAAEIRFFLKKKNCKVFAAPYDVRLPNNPNDPNDKIYTVIQPDICVICDLNKIDELGCKGAPDLIVEILSPSSVKNDLENKFELYQENGVCEYWIIYPGENIIEVFDLYDDKYELRGKYFRFNTITSKVLPDFTVDLKDIF